MGLRPDLVSRWWKISFILLMPSWRADMVIGLVLRFTDSVPLWSSMGGDQYHWRLSRGGQVGAWCFLQACVAECWLVGLSVHSGWNALLRLVLGRPDGPYLPVAYGAVAILPWGCSACCITHFSLSRSCFEQNERVKSTEGI